MNPPHENLPKPGDVLLGKYVLERMIGQGGMGVVFAARHELLGQRVAVKLVQPSFVAHPEAVARFVNEARASARIENDHVARVLDVGTIDGKIPYMVLEYLDGEDLEQLVDRGGPLPVTQLVDYLLEAIEGVAYAHAVGIVHRDLTPSNLFLAKRQDGTARVKVLDFGISKMSDEAASNVTRTNSMLGSPLYMSPEQLRNAKGVDQRTDIWAFGVIAFELLTGQPPFMGDNAVALFAAIQESDPPSMQTLASDRAIPPGLESVVKKCLKRRPDERFASLADLAIALAPFGSPASTRSVENAVRILASTARVPIAVASAPSVASPLEPKLHDAQTVSAQQLQTAGSWSEKVSKPKSRRSPAIYLLLLVPLFLVVGAASLLLRDRHLTNVASATQDVTPPSASPSAAAIPASTSTAQTPPSATVAVAPAVATAVPSATPKLDSKTKSATIRKPKISCDPPYEFDASGKKHWKPECL